MHWQGVEILASISQVITIILYYLPVENVLSDGIREAVQEVLTLEDDVDLEQVLEEAHRLAPQWDLMWVLSMDKEWLS